ncbi:glycine cleavage system aminomethyltransferase GcvT [Brachybacterium phenoliresistens]|uniref:Aminomethyltransferase n=1 Tax=Brachybacterium phenoliresistens TaxID=396014 RepID=Z9JQ44_9MICO|nr:glycine cleavage system aminomethyltransferase GcvT [Brachybacterium phenoliresistens]EWS79906.1 glycine cleavage system protein T [Brachybacterium phenoliresistens]
MPDQPLNATALSAIHEGLGAAFTDFAGWQMPVRYTSDLAEHHAVRRSAGIFDLSHMGEIRLQGPEAGQALDHALAGKLSGLSVGRAKYSLMLTEDGGVVDDVIVYRLAEDSYLVVANAGNAPEVARELTERSRDHDVQVRDESAEIALIAVQGPASEGIVVTALADAAVAGISAQDVAALRYYRVLQGTYQGAELLLARTGYTGEDGFELYVPAAQAVDLWELLTAAGGEDLVPCGLASRDTLRLEAGMPLYGHELGRDILPAQAGLGRVVALAAKGDFVGRAAIEAADLEGARVLVGLAAEGRRAGRAGSAVKDAAGAVIGEVTSGALSPTLGHPVAMAFIDPDHAEPGTDLVIDVRGKDLPARVVPLPFYTRD